MLGAVEKNFWENHLKKDPKDLIVVTVMPCTAKKYETDRNELKVFFFCIIINFLYKKIQAIKSV